MALDKFFLGMALRPKVLERDTGFLRVRLPGLAMLPGKVEDRAREILSVMAGPRSGITDIDADLGSGSLALRYDPEETTEEGVLALLKAVTGAIRDDWGELRGMSHEEIEAWARDCEARCFGNSEEHDSE